MEKIKYLPINLAQNIKDLYTEIILFTGNICLFPPFFTAIDNLYFLSFSWSILREVNQFYQRFQITTF